MGACTGNMRTKGGVPRGFKPICPKPQANVKAVASVSRERKPGIPAMKNPYSYGAYFQ